MFSPRPQQNRGNEIDANNPREQQIKNEIKQRRLAVLRTKQPTRTLTEYLLDLPVMGSQVESVLRAVRLHEFLRSYPRPSPLQAHQKTLTTPVARIGFFGAALTNKINMQIDLLVNEQVTYLPNHMTVMDQIRNHGRR